MSRPKTVSIFGSCISRDALEYDGERRLRLATYLARQSLFSAAAPPVPFSEDEICNASSFRRSMVAHDLRKDAFQVFREDQSEYLMIDLIDERFKVAEFRGSVVTVSNEFTESGILGGEELRFYEKRIDDPRFLEAIDLFCQRVHELYPDERVIIHWGRFLDRYRTKEGGMARFPIRTCVQNKKNNTLLAWMYSRLQKNLPGAYVIDICENYLCDETHKWGLNPIHYEPDYYREVLRRIVEYMSHYSD